MEKTPIAAGDDNSLLQGLETPRKNEPHSPIHHIVQKIIEKYVLNRVKSTISIELDFQDIQAMQMGSGDCPNENFPLSFYVLGNLLRPKNLEAKKSYQFNLIGGGGVSSIPLMTRFAYLDPKLKEKLRDCVVWEEQHADGIVFAEIVCIPEGRVGNILTRPSLYQYEIPIIGQCTVHTDFRISLDDLWVSVKQGKIILRSKRLNKQVIPRLSSAHNFHYGMVVYRFLCDLQLQSNCLNLSWDWGKLSNCSFLPRISYKHIILSRAKWNISRTVLKTLTGLDASTKILSLKKRFGLPDLVLLTKGDNELLIDLNNPIGSAIILKELGKHNVMLHEYLFDQYESPVRDGIGAQYNNEILIPLKVVDQSISGIKFETITQRQSVKRVFHPGSEWVFVKIYSSIGESDRILSEHILGLKQELSKKELIEKWFFIRYHDPEPHIRLRFLLRKNDGNIPFQEVVDCINKHLEPAFKKNAVFRIAYDTYERELQRYGDDNIEICESIFYIDSESTLLLLPVFEQREGSHLRWLTGMLGTDHLFAAFGLNIHQRISLLLRLRDAFLLEFSGYDKLKYKLDSKYREHRSRIKSFFDSQDHNDTAVYSTLNNRLYAIQKAIDPMKHPHLADHCLHDLLSSLSHMNINRLFNDKQREHEMTIYHFLIKHYISTTKRDGPNPPASHSADGILSV